MAAGKIPTRPLGKTGLQVPILAFGASPLGGIYQVRGLDVLMTCCVSLGFLRAASILKRSNANAPEQTLYSEEVIAQSACLQSDVLPLT